MTNQSIPKQQIEKEYNTLISSLQDDKHDLVALIANNSKLENVKQQYVTTIDKNIQSSTQLMRDTLDGMVWDNLVIAFFGETNAGKSTIIETLRILFDEQRKQNIRQLGVSQDGKIVGDGSADFTKIYEEYKLNVYGKDVTLIDVPGIEGKEEDFIDDIKKALGQAHIVFYVQGHNKKPDVATAEKIKRYLNDWVNVYSIYNVRGGASNYDEEEERANLYTSDVDKTYLLIEETFKDILEGVYKGNIALQALLAMCSLAKFAPEREDLIQTQQSLVNYFGSSEDIYRFSCFDKIVELLKNKTENFEEEILAANKQKLIAQYNHIIEDIQSVIINQQEIVNKLSDALKNYQNDVRNIIGDTKQRIDRQTQAEHDRFFSELLNEICDAIDYEKPKYLKAKIKDIKDTYSAKYNVRMQEVIEEQFKILSTRLEDKQKKWLDIYKTKDANIILKNDIGFDMIKPSEIYSQQNINVKELGKDLGNLALWSVLGGPIGTIISLANYGGNNLIRGLIGKDNGKERAKNEASKEISNAKHVAMTKLAHERDDIYKQLNQIKRELDDKLKSDIDILDEMEIILSATILQINHYKIKQNGQ